jgi:pimeloyl-ACP methyl ester carboxylesterase
LILFAGYDRDADKYRDRAIPLARRACLLLFAPHLDRERFPNWRYQQAGVYRDDRVQPESAWTEPVLRDLIAWARKWAGRPDTPTILFGHSAGAQFLSRAVAYFPPEDVYRIVIANPSAHVMPSLEEAAPYGFDGIFERDQRAERLRAYLRQRITIFLGKRTPATAFSSTTKRRCAKVAIVTSVARRSLRLDDWSPSKAVGCSTGVSSRCRMSGTPRVTCSIRRKPSMPSA